MLGLILVLFAAAMLAPGLVVGPSLDAAVFNQVGARILAGSAPYLAAWDHKPPGIYLMSAAVQAIFGWLGPWTADWLLSLGATAGLGVAVASVLRRVGVTGWPRALGALGVVFLAGNYLLALGGGLTEPVAAALVATSLALALRRPGYAGLIGVGTLLGMALLVSVQLLPGAAVVLFLALWMQPRGSRPRSAAFLVTAALAPIAATAAWLGVLGALPAAVDAVIAYSAAYVAAGAAYGAKLGAGAALGTVLLMSFLVIPAAVGAFSAGAGGQPRRSVSIVCLAWLAGSVALFMVQGRFYAHYAIPLAVPIGILAGFGLERIGEWLREVRWSGRRLLVAVPLAAALLVSVQAGVWSTSMQMASAASRFERVDAVSARLRDLPAGTMLVWGKEPRLYDESGRAPATDYIYFYPLTTPGYSTAAMVSEMTRELEANPPAIVVDAGSDAPGAPGFLPLLIARPVLTDGRDLDLLDPLRDFVAAHYQLAATVSGWPVYVLRSEVAAQPL